jgi:hypothetical protein
MHHLGDTIRFDKSGEERKALSDVERELIAIHVDPSDLDFFTWSGLVDIIPKENDLFTSRNTSRQHFSWRLLKYNLLIVSIDGLLLVNVKGPCRLARGTASQFQIDNVVNIERTFEESAFLTTIDDLFELVEYLASDGHHSMN